METIVLHTQADISPPACRVIEKMSFQYLQSFVMQLAISFWQTHFQRCSFFFSSGTKET